PHPRPRDAPRPREEHALEDHLRDPGHGLARFRQALAQLRDRVFAPGRARHAARGLGPHRGELGLLHRHHPGLARDDLPALLRRGRHLRGLRDGAYAGHPAPEALRARGLHHDEAPREHGEGDAGHGAPRRLRVHDRGLLRLVQRQRVRDLHDQEPDVRPVLVHVLVAHLLQRDRAEPALDQEPLPQRPLPLLHLARREHRHVARAVRHHRHEPPPGLPAFVLGHVRGDEVRLGGLHRDPRPLLHPVLPVPALPPRDLDLRDADDPARGGYRGGEALRKPRPPIYGLLAEFRTPSQAIAAAEQVHHAGYRNVDAYSPYPIEALSEALGFHRSPLPKLVLAGGVLGLLVGYGLEYWVSVIDYPLNIGGRPLHSWPAFIPPAFETTILFAAGGAGPGVLGPNHLPQPHPPLFNVPASPPPHRAQLFPSARAAHPSVHPP